MSRLSRRAFNAIGLGAALVSTQGGRAFAQAPELVIGAANPMSGVFAFAGVEGFEGGRDHFDFVNRNGGVAGRRIRYVNEDSGYRVDNAVAIFTRITSQHQVPVFFGDSTGFQKAINPELNRRGTTVMAGASFASEIDNPQAFPNQWIPGPNYSDQMRVLLRYIASQKKGASVVFVHSDTEFGRDPIAAGEAEAKRLELNLVEKIVTQPGSVDVSGDVLKIRRRNPDYVIFHGYVLQPIPEFMAQARQAGMTSKFMGTFYSTDTVLMNRAGAAADGYMGVSCYNFDPAATGAHRRHQGRQCRQDAHPRLLPGLDQRDAGDGGAAPHPHRQRGTERGEHDQACPRHPELRFRRRLRRADHHDRQLVPGRPRLPVQRRRQGAQARLRLDHHLGGELT
jgi:branched-chain amino acid transport system substrate-binding protein